MSAIWNFSLMKFTQTTKQEVQYLYHYIVNISTNLFICRILQYTVSKVPKGTSKSGQRLETDKMTLT